MQKKGHRKKMSYDKVEECQEKVTEYQKVEECQKKPKKYTEKIEQTCGMQNLQQRRDEFGVTVLAF